MKAANSLKKEVLIAGAIGIVAAFLGTVADYLLLYNPEGGYLAQDYSWMIPLPLGRVTAGHLLGVFVIPLDAVGVWVVYRGLEISSKKLGLAALGIGFYLGGIGAGVHGTMGPLIKAMASGADEATVTFYKTLFEPLAGVFVLGFFALSILFVVVVLTRETRFPKITALFNPFAVYSVIFVLYLAIPPIGNVLMPMAFNLSLGVFIAVCLQTGNWESIEK